MTISKEPKESESANALDERPEQEDEDSHALTEKENSEVGEIVDRLEELAEKDPKILLEVQAVSRKFSGPLPHPETMKGYEEVLPGASERIMTMAEKQMDHRMNLENQDMELSKTSMFKSFEHANKSLNIGGITTIVLVIGCIVLIALDKTVEGLALLAPIVISLIIKSPFGKQKEAIPHKTSSENQKDNSSETEEEE